ncbi:MAG: CHAT domain-containing protein [Acidobacteriota bacterium]
MSRLFPASTLALSITPSVRAPALSSTFWQKPGSICATSSAPSRGEGIVGLTRAFLYAGARSVVVSLWDVQDSSTAEFMKRFYRHLRKGEKNSDALRRARLDMIRSSVLAYRHPYYWSAFVMVGHD